MHHHPVYSGVTTAPATPAMQGGGTLGGGGIFLNLRSYFTEKAPFWCIFLSNLAFGRREKNIWGTTFASGGGGKKLWGGPKKYPTFFMGAQTILVAENKFYRGRHTGTFRHCLRNRGRSMVDSAGIYISAGKEVGYSAESLFMNICIV